MYRNYQASFQNRVTAQQSRPPVWRYPVLSKRSACSVAFVLMWALQFTFLVRGDTRVFLFKFFPSFRAVRGLLLAASALLRRRNTPKSSVRLSVWGVEFETQHQRNRSLLTHRCPELPRVRTRHNRSNAGTFYIRSFVVLGQSTKWPTDNFCHRLKQPIITGFCGIDFR